MEHEGVHKYSFRNALAFQENLSTRRKTSWSTVENQQQTQPTYDAGSGNRPGTHWWEASALTTAPSLLPLVSLCIIFIVFL